MAKTRHRKPCYTCRGQGVLNYRDWILGIGYLDMSKKCPTCKGRKVV